jgi:hypothetical protein
MAMNDLTNLWLWRVNGHRSDMSSEFDRRKSNASTRRRVSVVEEEAVRVFGTGGR